MDRPIKLALLTHWLSNRGGGVTAVVSATARALARQDAISVHVLGLSLSPQDLEDHDWTGVEVHGIRPWENRLIGFTPGLDRALAGIAPDVVHVHGLWAYPSIAAERWRRRSAGRSVFVSPHGMLEPWALANSGWKKRFAGAAFQRGALARARALHALSEAERGEIAAYLGTANTVVIPNGVDLPAEAARPPRCAGPRQMLYLGRLHPKKNLHGLLDAWARAGAAARGWQLSIAGWDQGGYKAALGEQAAQLGIADTVRFLGPLFGAEKDKAFRDADGFVLPSLSEGLPMVVLEAWSHGTPVLMTNACNLDIGFAETAAMRMGTTPEGAARDLAAFFALDDVARVEMGQRGWALAAERFSWEMIAAQFARLYRWSLGEAPPPDAFDEGTQHAA